MPFAASIGSASFVTCAFKVALLEHGLDDQVAAGKVLHVLRRLDQRQRLFGFASVARPCFTRRSRSFAL
jgi:hypothetical protein